MNVLKYPLAQRNPLWGTKKLGASDLSIGMDGCATCAICNGLYYFGFYLTPDVLAGDANNYTKPGYVDGAGLIIWQNLRLPGGFKFIKRIGSHSQPKRDDAAIQASLKGPNTFVLLEVDNGQHWVLATGRTLFGNDYKIYDSWFGDKRTACGTYKNITGSAHFGR